MQELLLPVAEGVDTRKWLIERRIATLEAELRAWAGEPNPPLARLELAQRLEAEVCRLYAVLESCEDLPRPVEVARAIAGLIEQDFRSYLHGFCGEQIVGWSGKLAWCPIALCIQHGTMIRTEGLRLRVYLDHALIDDGYDECRAELPPWVQRVTRLTTPPQFGMTEGTPITAGELRRLLASP